jgi:hypothetical protein
MAQDLTLTHAEAQMLETLRACAIEGAKALRERKPVEPKDVGYHRSSFSEDVRADESAADQLLIAAGFVQGMVLRHYQYPTITSCTHHRV